MMRASRHCRPVRGAEPPKTPAALSFVSASALGAEWLCSTFGEKPGEHAANRESLGRLVEVWA